MDPEITFKLKTLRESTSSDEPIDTSDELMEIDNVDNIVGGENKKTRLPCEGNEQNDHRDRSNEIRQKTAEFTRRAEDGKVRAYATPGENQFTEVMVDKYLQDIRSQQTSEQHHSAIVDENYIVVGQHLDRTIV